MHPLKAVCTLKKGKPCVVLPVRVGFRQITGPSEMEMTGLSIQSHALACTTLQGAQLAAAEEPWGRLLLQGSQSLLQLQHFQHALYHTQHQTVMHVAQTRASRRMP